MITLTLTPDQLRMLRNLAGNAADDLHEGGTFSGYFTMLAPDDSVLLEPGEEADEEADAELLETIDGALGELNALLLAAAPVNTTAE